MKKTLGRNCAFKRKKHKEQDCGELCECDCHKKKDILNLGSFIRNGVQGSFGHYFSHILPDGKEICLESCLMGYCVGIYNAKGGELIGDKECTKIEGMLETQIVTGFSILTGEVLNKAIEIANKKLLSL